MIPRYTRPEMGAIWTEDNKYKIWLEIELLAMEKQEQLGIVPSGTSAKIRPIATFQAARIDEIESARPSTMSLLSVTNVAESVQGRIRGFIHLGMTSSDVVDTAFSVQCMQAGRVIAGWNSKTDRIAWRKSAGI